jgi:hypothetical protein
MRSFQIRTYNHEGYIYSNTVDAPTNSISVFTKNVTTVSARSRLRLGNRSWKPRVGKLRPYLFTPQEEQGRVYPHPAEDLISRNPEGPPGKKSRVFDLQR